MGLKIDLGKSSKVTSEERFEKRNELFKDLNLLLNGSLKKMVFSYMASFEMGDPFRMNDDDIIKLMDELFDGSGKNKNLEERIENIAKHFLGIKIEEPPLKLFTEIFLRINSSIKDADQRINKFEDKINELENNKKLSKDERYKIKDVKQRIKKSEDEIKGIKSKKLSQDQLHKLKFYEYQMNENEKYRNHLINELIYYIPHKIDRRCGFNFLGGGLASQEKYLDSLKGEMESYKLNRDEIHDLDNKFSKLEYHEREEIKDMFVENESDFIEEANHYIDTYKVIEEIKNNISNNHLLYKRKPIIDQMIEAYRQEKFQLFCHICPLQIEGIFSDICLLIGVDENSLTSASLNEKIQIMKDKNYLFSHYEYFMFNFPKIRNQVAHGKIIEHNYNVLSILLLFDLHLMCNEARSDYIPINFILKLINNCNDSKEAKYSIPLAYYRYVHSKKNQNDISFDIDNFYDNENKILNELDNYFKDISFISILEQSIGKYSKYSSVFDYMIKEILISFKKNGKDQQNIQRILNSEILKALNKSQSLFFIQIIYEINQMEA